MRSQKQQRNSRGKKKTPRLGRCGGIGGKIKYPTEAEADREIRYRQALHLSGKVPVRTYKCPMCHKWHLTSMEKYNDKP